MPRWRPKIINFELHMPRRLTEKQFDEAAKYGRKMNDTTLSWAKEVLVIGRRAVDVATMEKVSKQRISQACKQILQRHAQAVSSRPIVPNEWRSVQGVLPHNLADQFDVLQQGIRKLLEQQL